MVFLLIHLNTVCIRIIYIYNITMQIGLWTVSTIDWISMHTYKTQITPKNSYNFSENTIETYWVYTCDSYFARYFININIKLVRVQKKTYTGVLNNHVQF